MLFVEVLIFHANYLLILLAIVKIFVRKCLNILPVIIYSFMISRYLILFELSSVNILIYGHSDYYIHSQKKSSEFFQHTYIVQENSLQLYRFMTHYTALQIISELSKHQLQCYQDIDFLNRYISLLTIHITHNIIERIHEVALFLIRCFF